MQVQGWLKDPNGKDVSGSFSTDADTVPTVEAGVSFYGRVTRTFDENKNVNYKAFWSNDGVDYKELCSYNVGQSNTNGRAAKYVYALQIGLGGKDCNIAYYLENLKITNLEATSN